MRRQQGNLADAIAQHTQAIELCETIGATCDLAEAYFQMGCSTRTQIEVRTNCFREAIALFGKIRAPQQIEQVKSELGYDTST
ncbi:MAG: hypothetical protein WA783_09180 [Phormidesmis sp.]